MCKLSIITPYYNCLEYTKKLAEVLIPQLTDEVEWIIIDDGCQEEQLNDIKATIIHLKENSGGASKPRNIGLDIAKGEYIAFIDADDIIEPDYIETILSKIKKEDFDYCFIGWKSKVFEIIGEPPEWNCCVWNTIYKKSLISDKRFREDLVIAEDYDFNCRVRMGKKVIIDKVLYFYNDTPNSLMKRGTDNE